MEMDDWLGFEGVAGTTGKPSRTTIQFKAGTVLPKVH
jgi:hypothetical protein